MALLGNYSVLNKTPGRSLSGSTVSDTRAERGKAGAQRGRFTGWGAWSTASANPTGYLPPYAHILPIDPGGISSNTPIAGVGALTGNLAGGRNGAATITGVGALTATGQLVVSGTAAIAGVAAVTANVVAALSATATLAGTSTAAATAIADGFMTANPAGVGALNATRYGTGTLEAAILPFTELSPQALAAAVWSSDTATSATAGTMGEALTFAQIALRNKMVTDPTAGTVTIYDTDGTTVLYVADLWQDAAGTIAYAGAGAERRERLV